MNTPQQQSPWRSPAGGGIPSSTTITSQICADCGAPDATWASVNRGVLICEECCSVHRVLGRHASQVKPLPLARARPQRRSTTSNASGSPGGGPSAGCWYWPPSLLTMVTTLYSKGANALWEHCLLHPGSASSHTSLNSSSSSPLALAQAAAASAVGHKQHSQNQRRKPSPKDPVHPNKSEFIRAKYQLQSFIHRPTKEDFAQSTLEDVSQQLHSSVRTGNIEISLRLLCLGADPNYWHPEKGNRPLHVAAKAGQASQVELLIVYGADPGAPDIAGKTPADHARSVPNPVLADRIAECQYEVTDRLAFFLCSRRPDHGAGQHFLIPEMGDPSSDLSELTKSARRTLQSLSNRLLETVTMDVYDEVDRRETEAVCQGDGTLTPTNRRPSGFLPVNPKLSAMHNQARQKLGTLNSRDLAALIIDLLNEIRRRQGGGDTVRVAAVPVGTLRNSILPLPRNTSRGPSTEREIDREPESPVYDVTLEDERSGHDEDYLDFAQTVSVPVNAQAVRVVKEPIYAQVQNVRTVREISQQSVTTEQYLEMKKALEETMAREKDLSRTVGAMKNDLDRLNHQVASLLHDHPRNNQESANSGMVSEQAIPRPIPFPRTLRDDSGLADTSEEVSVNTDRSPDRNPRSDEESVSVYTSQITQSIHELKRAAESEDHGTLSKCAQKIHTLTHNLVNHCLSFTEGERPTCLSDLLASSNRLLTDCLDFVNETNYFPDMDMEDASLHSENRGNRDKVELKQVLIDDAYNVAMGLKNVLLQFADADNADALRREQCSD